MPPLDFYPLDALRPKDIRVEIRSELKRSGCKLFYDLLKFDADVEVAVRYAIGNAICASSLTTARRLAYEERIGEKIVTMDGEEISKSGAMTGGWGAARRGDRFSEKEVAAKAERLDGLWSVTDEGSDNTRKVDFDVSISIKNTLENLGLAFNLSAPNDMNVQNQLSALGEEERAKQAITMLVTGRYGNIGAGGLSMGGALNSLLQTEISNITKNIKAVDISVGMESKDGSDDLSNMDYSFSLSKRFWNDRLNIIIGGKISSDSNDSGSNNESFIDNVSVEYRLDNSGTRYVKAFHSQDTESILEGEVMETGVGIVLRKKMKRMTELFKFGSGKKKPKDIKQ